MKPRAIERRKIARLVGRQIVKADPHLWRDATGKLVHAWVLELDDGTVVRFQAEELAEGGDYGVDILLSRKVQRG